MKKFFMMVLTLIMLISMMIPMASATSTTKVTVSSTSNSFSYSYSSSSSSSWSSSSSHLVVPEEWFEHSIPAIDFPSIPSSTLWIEPEQKIECPFIVIDRPETIPSDSLFLWTDEERVDYIKNLETVFKKLKEINAIYETHERMIKDFINGKWDGRLGSNSSNCYVTNRTYYWCSYNPLTKEWTNDTNINIDYSGSLPVLPGTSCSLAIDYENGLIEKWQLLEKKDSWTIRPEIGKIIGVQVPLEVEEPTSIGTVLTIDERGNTHSLTLIPDGLVITEN